MTRQPNILITGTPGTGKTTTSQLAASALNFNHIEVGKIVKEKGLHDGYDEEFQSYYIDEDKVVDELEPIMANGGNIVDHHGCDFFPERWFDLVVVLTCDNTTLYSRLENRNYPTKKIQENVECEIMQVVLNEAYESYKPEIVVTLPSCSVEEMESNVERIEQWVEDFMNKQTVSSLLSLLGNAGDLADFTPSQELIQDVRKEQQSGLNKSADPMQIKTVDHDAIAQIIKQLMQEQKEYEERLLKPRVRLQEYIEKKTDELEAEEIIGSTRVSQLKKELNDLKIKLKNLDTSLYESMDKLRAKQQAKLQQSGLDFKITKDLNDLKYQMWILAPYLQHLNS
ncbi:hypothetical protein HK103_007145 [Boothiomyces macroporosus]|uniref:Adenylate kinase isoenzyme 6 homolog n=1 Tax=Boothiomyces macroporosus TaxID=261099 RepID=A0AAD5Y6K2_9FUNG|nr:hypothetical protein HK103_007145 [Boothiomyces macroporosus]